METNRTTNTLVSEITTDKSRIDPFAVKALLAQTYWADTRSVETIAQSMEQSLCYGVLVGGKLVGFGRVVTDYTTVYWVCDIIIDSAFRGAGLGKQLMKQIVETPALLNIRAILATKDAHGLYEQYGFVKEPDKFMTRRLP